MDEFENRLEMIERETRKEAFKEIEKMLAEYNRGGMAKVGLAYNCLCCDCRADFGKAFY